MFVRGLVKFVPGRYVRALAVPIFFYVSFQEKARVGDKNSSTRFFWMA